MAPSSSKKQMYKDIHRDNTGVPVNTSKPRIPGKGRKKGNMQKTREPSSEF